MRVDIRFPFQGPTGFPGSALLCARLSRVPLTGAVSRSELLAIAGKAPTNLGDCTGFNGFVEGKNL